MLTDIYYPSFQPFSAYIIDYLLFVLKHFHCSEKCEINKDDSFSLVFYSISSFRIN